MCILANNMTTLNMKQNRHAVGKLCKFQDFYIKPCLLINMYDIDTKNNRAHLLNMSCIRCTVLQISCLQARRNTHTHTHKDVQTNRDHSFVFTTLI